MSCVDRDYYWPRFFTWSAVLLLCGAFWVVMWACVLPRFEVMLFKFYDLIVEVLK
jgi:hypothetical protein